MESEWASGSLNDETITAARLSGVVRIRHGAARQDVSGALASLAHFEDFDAPFISILAMRVCAGLL